MFVWETVLERMVGNEGNFLPVESKATRRQSGWVEKSK